MEKIVGAILFVVVAFAIGANHGCSSGKESAIREIRELRENVESDLKRRKDETVRKAADELAAKREEAGRVRADAIRKAGADEKSAQADFEAKKSVLEKEVSALEEERRRRKTVKDENTAFLRSLRGHSGIGPEDVAEYLQVADESVFIQQAAEEMSALYDAFGRTRQFYSDWRALSSLLKGVRQDWEKTERDFREAASLIQTEAALFGVAP